jgi:hypothetical protein
MASPSRTRARGREPCRAGRGTGRLGSSRCVIAEILLNSASADPGFKRLHGFSRLACFDLVLHRQQPADHLAAVRDKGLTRDVRGCVRAEEQHDARGQRGPYPPRASTLTRTPRWAFSMAAVFVSPITPCLAATYAPSPTSGIRPATDAVLTIAPCPAPSRGAHTSCTGTRRGDRRRSPDRIQTRRAA